jgi:hypothetical protein
MGGLVRSVVFLLLGLPPVIQGQAPQRIIISENAAKQLILAALPSKTQHLSKLGEEVKIADQYSRFYSVFVGWAGAPNGSMVVGYYYVDRFTGDVWDGVEQCHEYGNPTLRKVQAALRKRNGLSPSEYEKIKARGPMCGD